MPGVGGVGRLLILFGLVLVVTGVVVTLLGNVGIGRLPGDIVWRRGNFTLFFPLATSLLISIVLTVLLNLLLRR